MTTPSDIIRMALKQAGVLGVGQTATAEDMADAFLQLKWMLAQWQRKRWLVYTLVEMSKVSTGAQSYTIGQFCDFDITQRPDKIESAFARQITQSQPSQIDYPLSVLTSREDYNLIGLKQLTSFPAFVFYDNAWPIGNIYVWPIPNAAIYEIHINVKVELPELTALNQDLNLPPEYMAAIYYNLALRLIAAYKLPADTVTAALADEALNVLREANAQIAALQMPPGIVASGTYNPYSDRTS